MNKPAMTRMRNPAQAGFTLIELIVVIVILGILAATALPRFSSLGGDARLASLNAARGALGSVSAMVHGQALIDPTTAAGAGFVYEGTTVAVVNGYPAGAVNTATAAGLTNVDYTVLAAGTPATLNSPLVPAKSIVVQPNSVAARPAGLICYLLYTEAPSANVQPTIQVVGDATACN